MCNRGAISNLSGVVSLAMDIFRYGGIGVLPTDKDGGYCLIPKTSLVTESLNIVQTTRYREVRNPTNAADEFFDDYALAVKEVGTQLDDLRLVHVIKSWGREGNNIMLSRLMHGENATACRRGRITNHIC